MKTNCHSPPPLILSCFFVSSAAQHSPRPDAADQAIRNLEQRWLQNKDKPNALATISADDFVHVPHGLYPQET